MSKGAELQALHMGGEEGGKEDGDGDSVDAREASDRQGDGAPLQTRQQAPARADARRVLRPRQPQPQLRGAAAARDGAGAPPRKRRLGRRAVYGPEFAEPLVKVWATLGGICGTRLAAVTVRTVDALEPHREFEITDEVRGKLLATSAATIDRLWDPSRRRLRLKGLSHSKPGSLLKSQIPVRACLPFPLLGIDFDNGREFINHHLAS